MGLGELWARFHQNDNEFDDEEYDEYDEGYDTSSSAVTESEAAYHYSSPSKSDKVISMHNNVGGYHGASVKVVQPAGYVDVMKEPVRFLRENTSVVLNLEKVVGNDRKRIVDFMAGVVAAIDGRIVRIAECTYFVVPRSVDLSGDMMEEDQM